MTDLRQLKNIADAALEDLTVTNELKAQTLTGLNRKKTPWTKRVIMPAACAAALVAAIGSGALYFGGNNLVQPVKGTAGIITMADTQGKTGTAESGSTFSPEAQVLESWSVPTMEDAKQYMDGAVLIPSYLPENTALKEIIAAGPSSGYAIAMVMEFELEGRSFMITQDKGVAQKINPENSKEVAINGVKALVTSNSFDNGEDIIYSTTVRWYADDFMYAVQGSISEEEAIKVAQSLK